MSRKVLIVTGDGGDSYEALYAYHRFLEARWEPVVAAPSRHRLNLVVQDVDPGQETYLERRGYSIDADVAITAVAAREFAAILIVGGRAPEYLRNDASLLSLVHEFFKQEKCICAIGHGAQVLAAASIIAGRAIACHPNVRIEIERAGAKYSHKPSVRDGKIVTAQGWNAHPEFYREILQCLEQPPV